MMIKLLATAALTFGLLVSGPVIAAETLTHDGITYKYSVAQKGETRVITGYDTTNRRPFTLRVARGQVVGEVDGQPVSFALREVKPISSLLKATKVAAR